MRYCIRHVTRYSGGKPVSVGHNQAWLRPRDLPWQMCLEHQLDIDPPPSLWVDRVDYFGNWMTTFTFDAGYDALTVTARNLVEVQPREWPSAESTSPWEEVCRLVRQPTTDAALDAAQFAYDSPRAGALPAAEDYVRASFPPGRPILAAVLELTGRLFTDFKYHPQSTTVSTPIDEVFSNRAGVCQDFAHLEIAMLRTLGLPARYVSGYLRTIPPPGQPRLVGVDASHAWLSVYCGEVGWVDVDPTNNLVAGEDHIIVAWGRDYDDVPPLKGVFIGGEAHTLTVEVDVEPLEPNGQLPVPAGDR